jgi:hypothetical protein
MCACVTAHTAGYWYGHHHTTRLCYTDAGYIFVFNAFGAYGEVSAVTRNKTDEHFKCKRW